MTDAARRSIHQHRTDRRGKWICHGQSFESVSTDELLRGVPGKFRFWAGIDHAGGEQCLLYIVPAHRAGMRVRAFLRDSRSLHQLGIDVPINLAKWINDLPGIILRDYRH